MTEGMEAITTQALSLALDASTLRHQVLAQNIANANTLDYVPQRVSFESQMEEVVRGMQSRGSIDPKALSAVQFRMEPVIDANGQPGKVQLDSEMADVARNAVHYQALVKGLSRHFAILNSAVNDGKK